MIDPINSLAFSMQANKGVYAILVGSGISRAAQIPTGWEVTIELVRKAAAIQHADCEPDPAAWYRGVSGAEPDYSVLLDAVAKTPAERQQLLRPYFEPTEKERDEGTKQPTKAHRAIARLVKSGYVRVVITTNFDRLLEVALQDEGIQPTVLSTADQIAGAMPLVHTACTVIKVHGDYLDTRILNTPQELAQYPEAFNALLDRVFDEFGLIVSGWSADWDEALRAAITRAPNRRFSTYWSSRGDPSDKAADLIARRAGILIRSPDADSFFESLAEQVQSLEDFAAPHPLSSAAAVSALKRYLSEPKHRIALNDLIRREVDQVVAVSKGAAFPLNGQPPDGEALLDRLRRYEAASATLSQVAYHAGYWSESTQAQAWCKALLRLAKQPVEGGFDVWLNLRRYPAALLAYSFGLGAVQADNLDALSVLFSGRLAQGHGQDKPVGLTTSLWSLGGDKFKALPGRGDRYTPLHEHVLELFQRHLGTSFDDLEDLTTRFNEFEVLMGLYIGSRVNRQRDRYFVPPGCFCWQHESRAAILRKLEQSLATEGDKSPYVTTGLVGHDVASAQQNMADFEGFVAGIRW
ncbi:SIR2 family protein [Roseateles sp.]|uniref:SIR2 family protein n=1 Tax=Roseateles sp. TaxID=1971397 RepID=UPI0031DF7683